MEKEKSEIKEIISHQNTIQDKSLSDKIELRLQKDLNVSIPSIILEYIHQNNEENPGIFDLENLKSFFNNFGEVLNIVISDKKVIVLFKTFFIANICKEFLERQKHFYPGKKDSFKVRWFDFQKDNDLLIENLKRLFGEIYNQNIVNIKPEIKDQNNMYKINNNMNNNIGIKMNMNMNINNFNINTTMNPLGQNHNMFPNMNNLGMNPMGVNLQQQYLQQLIKNNNNINMQNLQAKAYLMKLAQAQNMVKNGGINILNNKQNNININTNINPNNDINNNINNLNNPLLNKNLQMFAQINPQLLQNQFKNFNQMMNPNPNNMNMNEININNNIKQNSQNNLNNNNYDEKGFGKYTCKYEILIANDKDFQVARRLIGSKGCNMKNIVNSCKSSPNESDKIKLRLRGRGSGYKEGPDNEESDEPLHLCISSKNPEDMKKACLLVDELLNKIHEDYKEYCQKNNVTPINTEIAMRNESKNLGFNNNVK